MSVRIGTRGSTLARWQADRVRGLLAARGHDVATVPIRTSGDGPLRHAGLAVKGLFTKELEEALLESRIDVAVHSLKDLMIRLPPGLVVAAYPERADPRDGLVTVNRSSLEELPRGARVGTSSLRRAAALRAARPDLELVALRGNVPTRVARVDDGMVDGAVLAMAGLERLGLAQRAHPIDPEVLVPAPGQGALALQARARDAATLALLATLDDPEVRRAVEAERAALGELETGCNVPIGAHCRRRADGTLQLRVTVYAAAGGEHLTTTVAIGDDGVAAGRAAGRALLERGAAELIARASGSNGVSG